MFTSRLACHTTYAYVTQTRLVTQKSGPETKSLQNNRLLYSPNCQQYGRKTHFLHFVASLFHTDFSYSTPLLLPWARFFHLPLKPKSKGNKTQSQKQHKGQDTNYYPAWKYLHNLCVASAGNGKFISNP